MSESCDEEFDETLEQVSGRARHSRVGGNPQGRVRVKQDNTNHQSPSPLMGEESKARVKTIPHHPSNPENPDPNRIPILRTRETF